MREGNKPRLIPLCPLRLETKLLSQESFDVWSAGQPQRDVATLAPKGDLEIQKRAAARLEVHPLGDEGLKASRRQTSGSPTGADAGTPTANTRGTTKLSKFIRPPLTA